MTTVVKISGKPIAEPARAEALWRALAGAGSETVIVHGGGRQTDDLFGRLGLPIERRDGIRLTPSEHMHLVAGVLAGEVNQTVVGLLNAAGGRAVGLSLGSFGVLDAEVDPSVGGRVGRIVGGDASTVRLMMAGGLLPVLSSIAADSSGVLLNVNADDAAGGLAVALGADRLLLLTDVSGVLDAAGNAIDSVRADEVERLIESGTVTGGMAAKIRACGALADRAGCEIVIAHWQNAAAALNSRDSSGTTIRPTQRREAGTP